MASEVKLGIIGVGQIGKGHVAGYAKVPGAKIVAVADLDEKEAQRVATENKIPNVFTDSRKLIAGTENPNIDFPGGHFLDFPMALVEITPSKDTKLWISWTH